MNAYHNIDWLDELLNINESNFEERAIQIFHYQAAENKVYRQFIKLLDKDPAAVKSLQQIPFLSIDLFKQHEVVTGVKKYQAIFESSGTTAQKVSKHYVADLELYHQCSSKIFKSFFGEPSETCFLALLPSYLERKSSSLVYMVQKFMEDSKNPNGGFFLHNYEELTYRLKDLVQSGQPTILFGVAFALLDLAEQFPMPLKENIKIIETGGMKGRRKEITREELHQKLQNAFKTKHIYSEYGMTELLSQAYMLKDKLFHPPSWMKILVRDPYDPFSILPPGQSGGINIIDLANIHSCCFIEIQDLGTVYEDGSFEIFGRMDRAELRGCNLMIE